MSPRLVPRLVAVGGTLFAAALGYAQLAAVSPFMAPQNAEGSVAPTVTAPLEYRGVAELPGGAAFRVVNPARKAGAWVKLNERDPDLGFVVKQHDAEHETVVVEYQGRTLTLPLHTSKVVSAGAATSVGAFPVLPPPAALPPTPPVPSALAAQQAQLDAVAAAVAQRRALREQAQLQAQLSVPLATQVIQNQQMPRTGRGPNAPGQNQNAQNNQNQNRQNIQRAGAKSRNGQPQ